MSHRVLRVTVRDGLAGVNRVVGLVRVRGIGPRSITAWVTDETDTWVIEHTLIANEERTALLHRQLERLPCVVAVQHALVGQAASPDGLQQGFRGTISAEPLEILVNSRLALEEQLEEAIRELQQLAMVTRHTGFSSSGTTTASTRPNCPTRSHSA